MLTKIEPKENVCDLDFVCLPLTTQKECVYFKANEKNNYCKYGMVDYYSKCVTCTSSVAKVNKMVLKLKELGINYEG
jgi:hypothetical protein